MLRLALTTALRQAVGEASSSGAVGRGAAFVTPLPLLQHAAAAHSLPLHLQQRGLFSVPASSAANTVSSSDRRTAQPQQQRFGFASDAAAAAAAAPPSAAAAADGITLDDSAVAVRARGGTGALGLGERGFHQTICSKATSLTSPSADP
jgi:hypothetical protein